jgi:hypothetical protein
LETRYRKIDMGNIRHKTQKNRHDHNWTQETERETRVTLDTRHRKIDRGIIGLKTHVS